MFNRGLVYQSNLSQRLRFSLKERVLADSGTIETNFCLSNRLQRIIK